MPNDFALPGGGFQNPASPSPGRGLSALNRIARDPASMMAGSAFLALATDFIARQGYNSAEQGVFNAPGYDLEGRIRRIWDTANEVNSGPRGAPGAIEAAREAELAIRDFGVEYWRRTGELYQHGYSIQEQTPLNDLFGDYMDRISTAGRTRDQVRDVLNQYGERWGIDPADLSGEAQQEILSSANPMDIAPEIDGEAVSPPPVEGGEGAAAADQPPDQNSLTPEEIAALMGLTYGTLRITGDGDDPDGRDCRLREYHEGCAGNMTPHHVVADRSFRYPATSTVYPGGVPHRNGLSICLEGATPRWRSNPTNEHGRVHALQNTGEALLGAKGTPMGTATLGVLEWNGAIAAAAETGCDPADLQRQLRDHHQNNYDLGPETRWRADPTGVLNPQGVGSPPIRTPY